MSTLVLQAKTRPGRWLSASRRFLDFVVDGRSLHAVLHGSSDLVSCLGSMAPEIDSAQIRSLTLRAPTRLAGNRHPIYVCAECGDLTCGAVTVEIVREGDHIVWRDFAYENGYDPEMTDRERFRAVGPFCFERESYEAAIAGHRT